MTYKLTYEEVQKLYNQLSNSKKIAYRYNPEDEYSFCWEEIAEFDPLESQILGEVVLLLPADCTFKKPINKSGYVNLFNKKKNLWEQVKNYKNQKYYDVKNQRIETINTYKKPDDVIILTKEDEQEIRTGKSVKLVNGKYEFYYTDEQYIDKIITEANSNLAKYDFYFNSDYPKEKIPVRMVEYREYLRDLNSKKDLKGKDIQNIKVMTYEEFAGV